MHIVSRWLKEAGFDYEKHRKIYYVDRHQYHNVVADRNAYLTNFLMMKYTSIVGFKFQGANTWTINLRTYFTHNKSKQKVPARRPMILLSKYKRILRSNALILTIQTMTMVSANQIMQCICISLSIDIHL